MKIKIQSTIIIENTINYIHHSTFLIITTISILEKTMEIKQYFLSNHINFHTSKLFGSLKFSYYESNYFCRLPKVGAVTHSIFLSFMPSWCIKCKKENVPRWPNSSGTS